MISLYPQITYFTVQLQYSRWTGDKGVSLITKIYVQINLSTTLLTRWMNKKDNSGKKHPARSLCMFMILNFTIFLKQLVVSK